MEEKNENIKLDPIPLLYTTSLVDYKDMMYNREYIADNRDSINNIIDYLDKEVVGKFEEMKAYIDYVTEQFNKVTQYCDYVSEQMDYNLTKLKLGTTKEYDSFMAEANEVFYRNEQEMRLFIKEMTEVREDMPELYNLVYKNPKYIQNYVDIKGDDDGGISNENIYKIIRRKHISEHVNNDKDEDFLADLDI
jgi:hypothetical protein